MPIDFSRLLVIGVSSRALFDLRAENEIFDRDGLEAYTEHQLAHETERFAQGSAFPLVRAILRLNDLVPGKRHAEVLIMSRNSAETSRRIFLSLQHHGLDITQAALTGRSTIAPYQPAYGVDLFLSAHSEDVQSAIDVGVPAGLIYPPASTYAPPIDQIRIAFDGDA